MSNPLTSLVTAIFMKGEILRRSALRGPAWLLATALSAKYRRPAPPFRMCMTTCWAGADAVRGGP